MGSLIEKVRGAFPWYQCHKKVRAVKIKEWSVNPDGSIRIVPADEGVKPFTVAGDFGHKIHSVDDPGYFVLYEDGYASWSPTKAFEEGYTRLA